MCVNASPSFLVLFLTLCSAARGVVATGDARSADQLAHAPLTNVYTDKYRKPQPPDPRIHYPAHKSADFDRERRTERPVDT